MSNAEIEQRAAHWLMRRGEPGWSETEEQELALWLDESMKHRAAFWRLEYGWEQADRMRSLSLPPMVDETLSRHFHRWLKPLAVAASIALLLVVGSALTFKNISQSTSTSYATVFGQRGTLALVDGSRVEVNANSKVRVVQTRSKRELWLDHGEAYFEVAHDASRPFVIYAGLREITVLGTKFVVRRDDDAVKVGVVDGRVRLDGSASSASSVIITRGDFAVADRDSTLIASNQLDRIERNLRWRTGMVSFDRVTLAEAAEEFNRYNRKQLIIEGRETASLKIGGSFQLANVEGFARLLQQAYGLHVEMHGDRIKISQQ